MSLTRIIREFCAWTPQVPVWRQLLGIFFGQLVGLGFIGFGLWLQLRGVESVAYAGATPDQPPRHTGGPWLLYLLGAGLMLLLLSHTVRKFNAWRQQRQAVSARSVRRRKRG